MEHDEQAMVIQWAEIQKGRTPELEVLHAVQNWAGVKSARQGARRKAEGVKAGVPDLHLPVPRGGHASLYIEMKRIKLVPRKTKPPRREKTKPTASQLEFHRLLRQYGNAVAICYTADEAIEVLTQYLAGRFSDH